MSKIIFYPNKALRWKCSAVVEWGSKEKKIAQSLKTNLVESKIGIGLSAPQIKGRKRIFVIKKENHLLLFVNPKIIDTFGQEKTYVFAEDSHGYKEEFLEGCLSFPDIYGPVKRWLKVKACWQEPGKRGKLLKKEAVFEGIWAIIFQHELDHLDGILFADHVKKQGQSLFRFDKEGEKKVIKI